MEKTKILFVCIHNSARSQIAEVYLNYLGGSRFQAESAGFEPGILNPIVADVLKEDGIDISDNKTKSVFEFYQKGRVFNYVIAVCDQSTAEKCPIFPGIVKRINWSIPDPAKLEGSYEEKKMATRIIIRQIKEKIEEWVNNFNFKKEEEYEE